MDIVEPSDEPSKKLGDLLAPSRAVNKSQTGPLTADATELRRFVELVFRHCVRIEGWAALRGFAHEAKSGWPAESAWCPWGPDVAEWAADMATDLARRTGDKRAVFSPPVALFGDKPNAKGARAASAANVVAGPVIAVELDSHPAESLATLEGVLGPATIIVASGGIWTAPDGSEQGKRHAYWRLARAATDTETLLALTRARRIACDLVGADATGVSVAHPMRWPGSWHTKGEPRLCQIVGGDGDRDVVLEDALVALEAAGKAAGVDIAERGATLRDERYGFKTRQPMSAKTLMDAVRLIPNGPYRDEAEAYDRWLRVGMGFYDASWASVDGLEAFHTWSAKIGAYYDAEKTDQKWERFTSSPPKDISAGKLLFLMREVEPGYVQDRGIAEEWAEPPGDGVAEASSSATPVTATAVAPDRFDASAPQFIRDLNREHAFVMNKGKALVANIQDGDEVTFSQKESFFDRYANRMQLIGKKEQSIAQWWWQHERRLQFLKGVDFDPDGTPPGVFNLWRGLPALTGGEGQGEDGCVLILRHIREIICADDEGATRYLLGWLAHIVQRPGDKPGVAVVLRGKKGTGKDTLGEIMDRVLGYLAIMVSNPEQIVGEKNAHMSEKLLFHIEEAVWAGNKRAESVLKSIITAPTMSIRKLFVDTFKTKNRMRILMTSNASWVVPASEDERRYFVLDVSDHQRHRGEWFDPLRAEIEGRGPACFARYLREFDLSGFDIRRPPDTKALQEQKQHSLPSVERWLLWVLEEGVLGPNNEWPEQIPAGEFFRLYERSLGSRRPADAVDPHVFGRIVKRLLKLTTPPRVKVGDKRQNVYRLPSLDEACECFFEATGVRPQVE